MNAPLAIVHSRRTQSGVALPVVLLLLLVVTLLGIASMRGAIMEQRMASNTTARSSAFQAAEAGLRQAEVIVRDGDVLTGTPTFPSSGCLAGRCAMVAPPVDPAWASDGFWADGGPGYQEGSAVADIDWGSGAISIKPRFVIELFGQVTNAASGGGNDPIDMAKPPPAGGATQNVFRVTSYAKTPDGVEVILQSLYRR